MRKLFTLLTLCLLASTAFAVEIVLDPTTDTGTFGGSAGAFSVTKDGITMSVSNGTIAAANNITAYRIYKGQTATFSSTVGEISEIKFECTASGDAQYGPGCFTANVGTYNFADKIGTWTGAAGEVVFTAATNQVRASKIIITVGQAGLAAPVITPATGTYYSPIEVTITCSTGGAKIYYTTNGSNPTTSSTQYSAAFTLSSNTTVKAISVKDGETSDVVSADYVFATATAVNNVAAYQGTEDNTVLQFTNTVSVLAQHNSYMYVKDNSGYALFFGQTGQTYKNGDVIPSGFIGTKTTYNGEPELKELNNFKEASSNSPIDPEMIGANQVGHDMFGHFVRLEHVSISTLDNKNYTLTDANGDDCAVYFGTMGVSAPKNLDILYTVEAIVGSYGRENTVYQLLPTLVKPEGSGGVGIGTMGNYDDNTELVFEYDATVLYHGNSRLFIKDETGFGLVYGNVGQTYKKGDVIPLGYGGKKTTYGGEPELASPFTGFQAATNHVTVTPESATLSDIDHEHFAHYVVLSNVDIIEVSGNNFKVKDANGNTCNGYNQFGQDVQEGHYDKLEGIVGSYGATNTVYQLLPLIEAPIVEVASINELFDLNTGRQAKFTTPLTVIYQNGPNMYVQDVEGTQVLVYGNVGGEFTNGDQIKDAIVSWTTYQGAKQLIPGENFVLGGHIAKVQPDEPLPIEEISQDMVHRYLSFVDVEIITEDDKEFIVDETGQLHLFNKFNIEYTGNAPYYIEGFLTVYKGELEFYPIEVTGGGDCGIKGDVNNDKEINIADINALLDIILGSSADECTRWRADMNGDGEIGLADVNALSDYILSH